MQLTGQWMNITLVDHEPCAQADNLQNVKSYLFGFTSLGRTLIGVDSFSFFFGWIRLAIVVYMCADLYIGGFTTVDWDWGVTQGAYRHLVVLGLKCHMSKIAVAHKVPPS